MQTLSDNVSSYEPQIVFALQQAEAATPVAEVCRKMAVVEATFYRWKKRYGGLGSIGFSPVHAAVAEWGRQARAVADSVT